MKTFLLLLLTVFLAVGTLAAFGHDPRPRQAKVLKRAFKNQDKARHQADKARFKTYTHPQDINLHPHDPRRFTKVKGAKPYKYPQPH